MHIFKSYRILYLQSICPRWVKINTGGKINRQIVSLGFKNTGIYENYKNKNLEKNIRLLLAALTESYEL